MKKQHLFFLSAALLILIAFVFVQFLSFHEVRVDAGGWKIKDPLFELLPQKNYSLLIFSITYSSLLLYFVLARKQTLFLSKIMIAYTLLLLFRLLTLSVIPLSTPEDIIFLQDPFLNNLIYSGEIDSDLFFSGHTALILLFFFLTKKWIFAFLALLIGLLLIAQHVHYTIDVLAALPFSYLIVKIGSLVLKKIKVSE
ncbi:MAG TPA: hypothetical protein EYG86_03600 [Crocinitomicaceae bacterium]|nr:hypothetical protein [Crocinitomicaceae bacterium]